MVDLHLHTTISDGRLTPFELVERVSAAGVRVMSVTDHDTTLATPDVRAFVSSLGIEAVSGIEVTAVEKGRDVHILGYFVREDDLTLGSFLVKQRTHRIERVMAIAARLSSLGMAIDVQPLIAEATLNTGLSIGRPQVARAMIRAGHVDTMNDAFERWLGHDRPAFVPREGPSCESVIDVIHAAGGLASLAHPGKTSIDGRIPALCAAGLDALEVHHSDHDAATVERYSRLARAAGVLLTGGSDFHGDPQQRRSPGSCSLPQEEWLRFKAASGTYA